jgi:hypothetical protein
LKKGDFVVNRLTGFPGIMRDGHRNRPARLTEAWGFCHEWGSQWADELVPIAQDEFEALKRRWEPEWSQCP